VAFFAYPNKPSLLKPEGCEVHRMTSPGENSVAALEALASALGAKPADVKPQAKIDLVKPTGAAVACPDRKVICMVGDGSAMYTLQSLWTQAREGLNVLTIVFANRIYQILRGEFDGVGAGEPGQRAQDMLKIDRPTLDWVALAKGMGVSGRAVSNADDFNKALAEAIAEPGPRLIEVQI
jgi:acetolactate synthase-1/2/3 large subunit